MRTSIINLLSEFDTVKFKDSMSKLHMSLVGDSLDSAETMLRIGNIDAAFEDVASAMVHTRWLLESSEDFKKDQLAKNVSLGVRNLLPRFDSRDRKHIIRDLATIEQTSEPATAPDQQFAYQI
ncbi:MAG: hypothetical protein WBK55_02555 [Alphaproteobacteria bacterium]